MCTHCGDMGFVRANVQLGHPDFGRAIPCACTLEKQRARSARKLEALDGLTETERNHRFETTVPSARQTVVRDALRNAFRGIYVLQGNPGAGKSHMMHCVVNQAREQGRTAVYAAMPDVLDYLRSAFNPRNEEVFEDRWHLLVNCDVLCLDELDEFSATDWAKERFLRLIDERWRKRESMLTVVALNGDARQLVPKVASRLTQGKVLEMRSADLRQTFKDAVPA